MDTPPPEPAAEVAPLRDDDNVPMEEVVVTAPRPITAASALTATAQDVAERPLNRAGDVAEIIPVTGGYRRSGSPLALSGATLPVCPSPYTSSLPKPWRSTPRTGSAWRRS